MGRAIWGHVAGNIHTDKVLNYSVSVSESYPKDVKSTGILRFPAIPPSRFRNVFVFNEPCQETRFGVDLVNLKRALHIGTPLRANFVGVVWWEILE